ncbi:hypothetical protein [Actinacidiphila sp. bgisy145]
MSDAYLYAALRTPFGRFDGALAAEGARARETYGITRAELRRRLSVDLIG